MSRSANGKSQGKVNKYEGWEMLSLVLDDHQVCRGLIAMNLQIA